MGWRVAAGLEVLRAELNRHAPNRSTVSDGSIGDAAHASRSSDHNPWVTGPDGEGVVRARDFTQDPAGGLDCNRLAVRLAAMLGKHPALGAGAYVIWEGRIVSTDRLSEGWRPYYGSNQHRSHLHLSVGLVGYDSTTPWNIFADDQEDDMAQHAEQLDRIENKLDQTLTQAKRARAGSFNRDKRILDALDGLVETTGKTARKTQVAAIKALLKEHDAEVEA